MFHAFMLSNYGLHDETPVFFSFLEQKRASAVHLIAGTGSFEYITPSFVSHECCMQYQFECHILAIRLTAMNSGRE